MRITLKAQKKNSTKLLVSFRNIKEISDQNFKYFDICDLKDPNKGSIGAWGEKNIIEVVKRCKKKVKVSATIGDIFSVDGNQTGLGSNENAIRVADLESKDVFGNDQNFFEAYLSILTSAGNLSNKATVAKEALEVVYGTVRKRRD